MAIYWFNQYPMRLQGGHLRYIPFYFERPVDYRPSLSNIVHCMHDRIMKEPKGERRNSGFIQLIDKEAVWQSDQVQ